MMLHTKVYLFWCENGEVGYRCRVGYRSRDELISIVVESLLRSIDFATDDR
jgi:hypothetical protein